MQDKVYQISDRYSNLSDTNKKIAEFLSTHDMQSSNYSITQLAKKIGVDPSSITRFCQTLGFAGFPDLKYSLQHNLLLPILRDGSKMVSAQADTKRLIVNMGVIFQQVIGETIKSLNTSMIDNAVDRILSAGAIHAYGSGGSATSAGYAQSLFMQIGIPCYALTDLSLALAASEQLSENDVAIGITSSGETNIVVDVFEQLKPKGTTLICISGFPDSTAMKLSTIPISYSSGISDDIRHLHLSRMCEAAIIGVLQLSIINRVPDGISLKLPKTRDAILKGRKTKIYAKDGGKK